MLQSRKISKNKAYGFISLEFPNLWVHCPGMGQLLATNNTADVSNFQLGLEVVPTKLFIRFSN